MTEPRRRGASAGWPSGATGSSQGAVDFVDRVLDVVNA